MISPLHIFKTEENIRQFLTFICVGVINTLFGYSVFACCIFIGLHYTIATLMTTILGILFNFLTVGTFVFKNQNKNLILQFVCMYAVLYVLGTLFIGTINHVIHNLYLAGAINALMMPPLAFYLNKRFVFRATDPTHT